MKTTHASRSLQLSCIEHVSRASRVLSYPACRTCFGPLIHPGSRSEVEQQTREILPNLTHFLLCSYVSLQTPPYSRRALSKSNPFFLTKLDSGYHFLHRPQKLYVACSATLPVNILDSTSAFSLRPISARNEWMYPWMNVAKLEAVEE